MPICKGHVTDSVSGDKYDFAKKNVPITPHSHSLSLVLPDSDTPSI